FRRNDVKRYFLTFYEAINFNVSVAEVGSNDVHQRAEIGFVLVGNNKALINSKIDKIFNMADEAGLAEMIDNKMEIINL
ncbi:MAG: DUF503 domain-containing protein, partial [Desulfobacterales bacterium]|nr:DUF503 domain-containing protein [Desulfobacterales bacterium]